jgi:hypothetical protein
MRSLRVLPVLVLVAVVAYLEISWKYADGVPVDVVRAHSERAFFCIQCVDDRTVAMRHGSRSAGGQCDADRQLRLVNDCGHVTAFVTHPQRWTERVVPFLDRQMSGGR